MTETNELNVAAYGGWVELFTKLANSNDLTSGEASAATADVLAGAATPAQIAALIMALKVKGETSEELAGMSAAMLGAAAPLRLPPGVIDIVGTGGSAHRRKHALNVSTMACFVAAAAGALVCKHGNFRATSTSGSSDFLGALGLDVMLEAPALQNCVEQTGLGFAQAKVFHPAMRHAGPVRAELAIPTVFNLLGPISHPAGNVNQVVGAADESTAALLAGVLAKKGVARSWVVNGSGGLDELTTIGLSVVFEVTGSKVTRQQVDPSELGIVAPASFDELAGGDAKANVAIFNRIVGGEETGPRADIVNLNAAAGLVVAGLANNLEEGLNLARSSVANGAAKAKLKSVRELVGNGQA